MNSAGMHFFALDANLVIQVEAENNDARSWADAAEQKKIIFHSK